MLPFPPQVSFREDGLVSLELLRRAAAENLGMFKTNLWLSSVRARSDSYAVPWPTHSGRRGRGYC